MRTRLTTRLPKAGSMAVWPERRPVRFAWIVLLAFARLATSSVLFTRPLTTTEAFDVLEAWLRQPSAVVVEPTGRHLSVLRGLLHSTGTAANLVNDAHLAALAIELDAEVAVEDFGALLKSLTPPLADPAASVRAGVVTTLLQHVHALDHHLGPVVGERHERPLAQAVPGRVERVRHVDEAALVPDGGRRGVGRDPPREALREEQPDQLAGAGAELLADDHPARQATGQL
ncbi:MAG: hypothetical protein KY433_09690, partial [Actinobacteria bacterium]|nr:hypothetical protein [Actinomycetota bacterium]